MAIRSEFEEEIARLKESAKEKGAAMNESNEMIKKLMIEMTVLKAEIRMKEARKAATAKRTRNGKILVIETKNRFSSLCTDDEAIVRGKGSPSGSSTRESLHPTKKLKKNYVNHQSDNNNETVAMALQSGGQDEEVNSESELSSSEGSSSCNDWTHVYY